MARHNITVPDGIHGDELRTIIRDDEAGTVEGDHSKIANFQRIFDAPKLVTVGTGGGGLWHLKDAAEFLIFLVVCFYPVQREPLRSTLPPVFDGVEVLRSELAGMPLDPNALY